MTDISNPRAEGPDYPRQNPAVPEVFIEGTTDEPVDPHETSPDQTAIDEALAPDPEKPTGLNIPLSDVVVRPGGTGDEPPLPPPTDRITAAGDDDHTPRVIEHTDAFGNVAVTESRSFHNGKRSILVALDTASTDLSSPMTTQGSGLGQGFVIEGEHPTTAVLSEVIERDTEGRPTKVAQSFDSYDPDEDPDARIHHELHLAYTAEGLLGTVTESRDDGTAKTRYQNVFSAEGVRTGLVQSELTDINPATGEEAYDVTQVVVYERHSGGSWREITYRGYRDGLIPEAVEEGPGPTAFSVSEIQYLPDDVLTDQLQYAIAAQPVETILVDSDSDEYAPADPVPTITLPTWIPKTAAHEVAAQSAPLEQLAAVPDFPETRGVQILSQAEAYHSLDTNGTDDAVVDFMNQVANRETVVLQPRKPSSSLISAIAARASNTRQPLTEVQKLGLLVTFHPIFARQDAVVAENDITRSYDENTLYALLDLLDTDKTQVTLSVMLLDNSLNEEAQRRLAYLLREQ